MRVLVACISILALSGCGFHLRQPIPLPASMARVQVHGIAPYGDLAYEIRDQLADSGAEVVSGDQAPGVLLEISAERYDRLVSSVDSQGKVTQYELRYSLSGALHDPGGAELVPWQNVLVKKLLNSDPNNALGTSSEEEMLQREMRHEVVRQLLRQLRTVLAHRPQNP